MKKNLNKLATLALTGVLMTGMSFGSLAAAIGGGAVTTETGDTSMTFKKELKLTDVDSSEVTPTTPGVTFYYSISGATEDATITRTVNRKNVTLDVYAPASNGVTGNPTVGTDGSVAFGSTDSASDGKVSKGVTVNFSGVTFTKPGIYRWVIKETGYTVTDGGTYTAALKNLSEANDERYLDVYVERSGESCVIKGYVLYKEGTAVGTESGKSGGYTYEENTYSVDGENENINSSEYRTYDVTIQKLVEGSMASRTKKFQFTTDFANISSGVSLTTSVTEGKGEEVSKDNHSYVYELSHEGTYTIQGIPFDATATVKENDYSADGYSIKTVAKDNVASTADENGKYALENNNESNKATAVVVTNEITDIPVTGVVLNIAPYAAMILGAGAFAGVFLGRKKSEDEE